MIRSSPGSPMFDARSSWSSWSRIADVRRAGVRRHTTHLVRTALIEVTALAEVAQAQLNLALR